MADLKLIIEQKNVAIIHSSENSTQTIALEKSNIGIKAYIVML